MSFGECETVFTLKTKKTFLQDNYVIIISILIIKVHFLKIVYVNVVRGFAEKNLGSFFGVFLGVLFNR